jgi:hypothetical protein
MSARKSAPAPGQDPFCCERGGSGGEGDQRVAMAESICRYPSDAGSREGEGEGEVDKVKAETKTNGSVKGEGSHSYSPLTIASWR